MASVRITKFGGMAPIVHDANLPAHMATMAIDVDLSRHTIRPWQKPLKVDGKTGGTIWREGCCTVAFDGCDSRIAHIDIGCERLIHSRAGSPPMVATVEDACAGNWCRLGFPCDLPAPSVAAPSAAPFVAGSARRQQRQYAYRLVNKFGEKSQLSEPSPPVEVDATSDVSVGGFPQLSQAWCVTGVQLFRTEVSFTAGNDRADVDGSWFMVGEGGPGAAIVDSAGSILDDELDSADFTPPRRTLSSIVYLRNGVCAGIDSGVVMFSVRNHYHAWPAANAIATHDKPQALVAGPGVAYVLTDGRPAVISAQADCETASCKEVKEANDSHPIVSSQSAAAHAGLAVWATKDGIAVMGQDAQPVLVTKNHISHDQWLAMSPWEMVGVVHDGHYFGFTSTHGIRFRLPDNTYQSSADIALTLLSVRPRSVYRSTADELFLSLNDGIYKWNADSSHMKAVWHGASFKMPGVTAMAAYKAVTEFDKSEVSHWVDGELISVHEVFAGEPHRLPMRRGIEWQVEIETRGEVSEYHLAGSATDLARGGND